MGCLRAQAFPFAVSVKIIFIGDFGLYLFLVFILIPSFLPPPFFFFLFVFSFFKKRKEKEKKPRMLYVHYSC